MVNLAKERKLIEADISAIEKQRATALANGSIEAGSIQDQGMEATLNLLRRQLQLIFDRIEDRVGQYEVTRAQTDADSLKIKEKF